MMASTGMRSAAFATALGYFLSPTAVFPSDLEDLAREGFAVAATTRVEGDFEGCDFDKYIAFDNGLLLQCMTFKYRYRYRPEVLIMRHPSTGEIRVLIDEEEYRGRLYKR